ncbi:adenylyl-sulfate kinase [Pelomonas saccharophila]|uniref:Adenylyl-sulfate kinase n=1 Tax=Roseateles saccharophilus TaxID=304 RepID=A0ABU1YSQ0_ROSSA|nr:adenylyl-sulfate kinase [Roseateles saccharophilus]
MTSARAHQARVLWLTGLSGAGKSTLAVALHQRLVNAGVGAAVLDGDAVRAGLCRGLGFSPEDRRENIRRVAEVAKLMREAGLVVICALISPLREDRAMARDIIGAAHFREVHVATPLEVCERRDPKGLYRNARAHALAQFTGVSAPYEEPQAPDLRIDASRDDASEAVAALEALLRA